jgi:hypothetical protein
MTEASRGLGGEGLSLLQVRCDSAPVRPAAPGSRGELAEGAGDPRQVPDQCQDVVVRSGHRQGSRGGQRRCCRFNWRIARRLHDISPSIVQLRPCTTTELAPGSLIHPFTRHLRSSLPEAVVVTRGWRGRPRHASRGGGRRRKSRCGCTAAVQRMACASTLLTAGQSGPPGKSIELALTCSDNAQCLSAIVTPRRRLTASRRHELGDGAEARRRRRIRVLLSVDDETMLAGSCSLRWISWWELSRDVVGYSG